MLDLHAFKRHLGVTDTKDDVARNNSLQAAISLAAVFTNANYSSAGVSATKSFDYPIGSNWYFIPTAPIATVDSVVFKEFTYDSIGAEYIDETLVEDECYFVDYEVGTIEFNVTSYPTQKRGVSVTYTTPSGIPRDYVLAVYELATYYFNREYDVSKSIGGQDIEFKDENILPTQVRTILSFHRCP